MPAPPRLSSSKRGQQAGLAVEHTRRLDATLGRSRPQLRERDRVERAGGDRTVDTQATEPVDQLAGGLACEGEREHVARLAGSLPECGTRCDG